MSAEDEIKLATFKQDVLKTYDGYKPSHSQNLPRSERDQLKSLPSDRSVVVKQSDKSKKFVAMKQEKYLEKADHLLADRDMYERVDMTVEIFEKMVEEVIDSQCSNMDKTLFSSIKPKNTRLPEFYGLPKDHKASLPLRPVVSTCDSPTTALSTVLERILNQLLDYVPAHLKNTTESLEHIREHFPDLQAPPGAVRLDSTRGPEATAVCSELELFPIWK